MTDRFDAKLARQEAFWQGEGPSLILIPPGQQALYDVTDYPSLFDNPQAMWQSEMGRAESVVAWPTDGIASVRPNLGVIFVPAMAGLDYQVPADAMPWPGEPLTRAAIRAGGKVNITQTKTMRLAEEFYAIHQDAGRPEIVAYHADTQGVFDIAHLLNGAQTFYELADQEETDWIDELLEISLDLYVRVTAHLKSLLAEDASSMIHGHGTSQGVLFPTAGARMAEDTAILLSPAMIDRFIVPAIRKAATPFGGAFVHFCGRHVALLERLCQLPDVRAIDLGNPEMYDSRWVLEQCAATGTVLHSRLSEEPGEDWRAYVQRLGGLVRETGARVILRPMLFPKTRAECRAMRELWHELTQR